jgi:hypothetical protein
MGQRNSISAVASVSDPAAIRARLLDVCGGAPSGIAVLERDLRECSKTLALEIMRVEANAEAVRQQLQAIDWYGYSHS